MEGLAPDGVCATRPDVQANLQVVKDAQKAWDYVDLSAQDPSPEDLERAAALPAGDGHQPGGGPVPPAQELQPEHPVERGDADPDAFPEEVVPGDEEEDGAREAGWEPEGNPGSYRWKRKKPQAAAAAADRRGESSGSDEAQSVVEKIPLANTQSAQEKRALTPQSAHEKTFSAQKRRVGAGRSPQKEAGLLEDVADRHGGGGAAASACPLGLRERPSAGAAGSAAPRSRSPRGEQAAFHVRQNGILTEKLKNKLLDREVPYGQIPPADREL